MKLRALILSAHILTALASPVNHSSTASLSDLPNDILREMMGHLDISSVQLLSQANAPFHTLSSVTLSIAKAQFLVINTTCGYELSKALHPSLGIFVSRKPAEINIDLLSESCLLSIPHDITLLPHIKRVSLAETHSSARINALVAFLQHSSVTGISIALDVNVEKNLTLQLQTAINESKVRQLTLLNQPFFVPLFPRITSLSIPSSSLLSYTNASFPSLERLLQGTHDIPLPLSTRSYSSDLMEPLASETEVYITLLPKADELLLAYNLFRSQVDTLNLIVTSTPVEVKEIIRAKVFKTIRIRFEDHVQISDLTVWGRGLAKRIRLLQSLEIRQVNGDVRIPRAIPLGFLKTARMLNHLSLHTFLSLRSERHAYMDNNVNALLTFIVASKIDTLELDISFHNSANIHEFTRFLKFVLKGFKGTRFNFRTKYRVHGNLKEFYTMIISTFRHFRGSFINGLLPHLFIDGLEHFSQTEMAKSVFTVSY